MATLALGSNSYVYPRRNSRVKHFRVAASQTIVLGDALQLTTTADAGNQVKKSVADPTTDRGFVGFAAEAITTGASVTADQKIPVWLADGLNEFRIYVADTQALDNDDIGVEYGIVEDTTNKIWRLDRTETTAKLMRVIELLDAHGDVNGAVVAQVIAPERLYHD